MKLDLDLNLNQKKHNSNIAFQLADVSYVLKQKKAVKSWLSALAEKHGYHIAELQYVFCSDTYLLDINRQFLQHDYFTDIITFDLSEKKGEICSEIYISIPRVKENAQLFGVSFQQEMHRVLAHGVLHLCGFKDKTPKQEKEMRAAENNALAMFNF